MTEVTQQLQDQSWRLNYDTSDGCPPKKPLTNQGRINELKAGMERKPTVPQASGTYGEREGKPPPSPAREDFIYLIIPLPCPFFREC